MDTELERTTRLVDLLAPERLTRVVDIGANLLEDEPPYARLLRAGLCEVTGFEPQADALEKLRAQASAREHYLPHAIGDGGEHVLHLCASSGFSSLFAPDARQLRVLTDFPRMAEVVSTEVVQTARLDDIDDLGPVDHLKMDVQGAELMIVQHARAVMAGVTSLQVEAGFHRLYRDQPTFAELDLELRSQGFVPQSFVTVKDWPVAPVEWADPLQTASRQLVEADVLYVRDMTRWEELPDEQLRHLAIMCDGVYGQVGVALRAVGELARRGAVPASSADDYAAWCR